MAKASGPERSAALLKMKQAFKKGLSGAAVLRELKTAGLSYRRTDMQADWRSVANVEKKTGLLRYVRKDYYPTAKTVAEVSWKLSQEYMYKVKVETRLRPGEPPEERFVNIMSDRPMTPREMEARLWEKLPDWFDSIPGVIERISPETAYQRVIE